MGKLIFINKTSEFWHTNNILKKRVIKKIIRKKPLNETIKNKGVSNE